MVTHGEATPMATTERKYFDISRCPEQAATACCMNQMSHNNFLSIDVHSISYDINDAEDVEQVCTAMQSKGGSYSTKGPSAKIYSYNGKTSQNTYTWGLADSSSNNSQTSAPTTTSDSSNGGGGDGFDWEGTKQQVGDTYSNVSGKVSETYGNVSEKVGNGISRASEKSGLAIEEVVGIVLGALAGLCLFLTCACYCCCKRTDEDPKQVHLIGRERKEWQAKDKWNTTQNRDTWA